jgi:hypothetical protein
MDLGINYLIWTTFYFFGKELLGKLLHMGMGINLTHSDYVQRLEAWKSLNTRFAFSKGQGMASGMALWIVVIFEP